jgi:hypothetical protein
MSKDFLKRTMDNYITDPNFDWEVYYMMMDTYLKLEFSETMGVELRRQQPEKKHPQSKYD